MDDFEIGMDLVASRVRVEKAQRTVDANPTDTEAQKTLSYQMGYLMGLDAAYEKTLTPERFHAILSEVMDAFASDPVIGSPRRE